MDPVNAGAAVGHVKAAVEVIDRIAATVKSTYIRGQELRFLCPEGEVEYSIALEVKGGIRRVFANPLEFKVPELREITIKSFPGLQDGSAAALATTDGIIVLPDRLPDEELFTLNFRFKLEQPRAIDSLVRKDHERDAKSDQGKEEYWMSAQLRQTAALRTKYGRVDLKDLDLSVNVGVHQDLKDVVPQDFVRQLEIASALVRERERGKKYKLMMQHLRTRPGGLTGKEEETLAEIQALLLPPQFKKFVDVRESFKLSDVIRGADLIAAIPFMSFPKHMTVVSRTNLSLDKPAAEGRLVYKKSDFQKNLAKLFPKAAAKLKELEDE